MDNMKQVFRSRSCLVPGRQGHLSNHWDKAEKEEKWRWDILVLITKELNVCLGRNTGNDQKVKGYIQCTHKLQIITSGWWSGLVKRSRYLGRSDLWVRFQGACWADSQMNALRMKASPRPCAKCLMLYIISAHQSPTHTHSIHRPALCFLASLPLFVMLIFSPQSLP